MAGFTDVQWSAMEPLIEAVRRQTGRELSNLRRTFEAIVWPMQNGAKWRAIPAELGLWWMAAQTFLRWSKLGVWECLFERAKAASWPELGLVFMDGTIIRAHQKAAGAVKGGTTAKRLAEAALASAPRPTRLRTRGVGLWASPSPPGQASEAPQSFDLLDFLPATPGWVVADRGYSSHALRTAVWELGSRPAIPPRCNEAPVHCPDWLKP